VSNACSGCPRTNFGDIGGQFSGVKMAVCVYPESHSVNAAGQPGMQKERYKTRDKLAQALLAEDVDTEMKSGHAMLFCEEMHAQPAIVFFVTVLSPISFRQPLSTNVD
jgi:hypothetical protein